MVLLRLNIHNVVYEGAKTIFFLSFKQFCFSRNSFQPKMKLLK